MPRPRPGYKDCQFCKDEVTETCEFRHKGGKLYHVDCLIRLLLDKIHDLQAAPDLSKVRGALREYNRIVNRMALERPLLNGWYGTSQNERSGTYKNFVNVTWGDVQDLARKAVLIALKNLET